MVEPLVGADLVALAQAHALDVSTFPHPSLPVIVVVGPDAPPTCWVARAEHGGPVVGFVSTQVKGVVLDIAGLAVESRHRRSGLGRALLHAALRSARTRGLERVLLHVSTGNAEAIALYTSEGFRKRQLQPGYYTSARFPDGGDAWLMSRSASTLAPR